MNDFLELLAAWQGQVSIRATRDWVMLDLELNGKSVFEADHETVDGAASQALKWIKESNE